MLNQAKKEVSTLRTKSILNIIGMAASLVAIASLWLFIDFQSWTTHAGLSITITAIAIYTFILYRGHRLISQNDVTAHPEAFLAQLKTYQLSRFKLYNKLYWFYVIALTLGMILYFFEILAYFELPTQILIIILSLAWMVFCSTLLRNAVIKREKERIALLIEKFERLSSQF